MTELQGQIPTDPQQLEHLPGIGRYTAGAIASIAFGRDEPALDANIRRVLSRVYNMALPARSPEGERRLWALAKDSLPPGRAGDFNQALMDLGSSICTPHNPACLICPIAALCKARELGVQEERPVLEAKAAVPHYTVTAAILRRNGQVLIARRPAQGLLGGMWEFPGGKVEPGESLPDCLRREIQEELGVDIQVGEPMGIYQHGYTHFKVTLHAFCCQLAQDDAKPPQPNEPQALHASEIRWVGPHELSDFPMGKIDRQISRRLVETGMC